MKSIQSLQAYQPLGKAKVTNPVTRSVKPNSFLNQLQTQLNKSDTNTLKISKHAADRMSERQIQISPEKWATIDQKVNEAKAMGIKDSLVLTDNEAMVVNAANKTVITVMNRSEASKQIFTNINGTIVLD